MKAHGIFLLSLCQAIVLGTCTSCSSTSTQGYLGTMAGAEIGGTIGEAIGWLSTSRHDGPGKAMLGSVIGTVAGAVVGNQVAANAEKRKSQSAGGGNDSRQRQEEDWGNAGYQTGGGYQRGGTTAEPQRTGGLSIQHAQYQDEDGDGRFSRYETLNVIYEVRNETAQAVSARLSLDSQEQDKCLVFSPATEVTIQPYKAIRYKAKVFMKNQVKESQVSLLMCAESDAAGRACERLVVRCK